MLSFVVRIRQVVPRLLHRPLSPRHAHRTYRSTAPRKVEQKPDQHGEGDAANPGPFDEDVHDHKAAAGILMALPISLVLGLLSHYLFIDSIKARPECPGCGSNQPYGTRLRNAAREHNVLPEAIDHQTRQAIPWKVGEGKNRHTLAPNADRMKDLTPLEIDAKPVMLAERTRKKYAHTARRSCQRSPHNTQRTALRALIPASRK